jgi:hypothetical protein
MTESLEWDFPPTRRYHRLKCPRVEVMPPPQPEQGRPLRIRLENSVTRHRPSPDLLPVLIVLVIVALIFWRYGIALLLLALIGSQITVAFALVVAILAVAGWRENRAGRPF